MSVILTIFQILCQRRKKEAKERHCK